MKRYKVINKQRFYLFITFLFIMIFAIVLLFTNSKKVHSEIFKEEYQEIKILQGDTLWSLALKNMPDKYDIRYLVYKLKEFNDLDTAYIYPGDTIKIPILEQ